MEGGLNPEQPAGANAARAGNNANTNVMNSKLLYALSNYLQESIDTNDQNYQNMRITPFYAKPCCCLKIWMASAALLTPPASWNDCLSASKPERVAGSDNTDSTARSNCSGESRSGSK